MPFQIQVGGCRQKHCVGNLVGNESSRELAGKGLAGKENRKPAAELSNQAVFPECPSLAASEYAEQSDQASQIDDGCVNDLLSHIPGAFRKG